MSWDGTAEDLEAELESDANASYYEELDQAAMVEADRLQDEVVELDHDGHATEAEALDCLICRQHIWAAGPYEHTGAYVGSELFDTTGTPRGFCPDCEHAPCVAGGLGAGGSCKMRPRFTIVGALRKEIFDLLDTQIDNPLWFSLRQAVYAMGDAARHDQGGGWVVEQHAAEQLRTMAVVRDELRKLVQS